MGSGCQGLGAWRGGGELVSDGDGISHVQMESSPHVVSQPVKVSALLNCPLKLVKTVNCTLCELHHNERCT